MAREVVCEEYTGSSAISKTITPGCLCKVVNVQLNLNAVGGAGNFTVSTNGVTVKTADMTSATDAEDTNEHHVKAGNSIVCTYTNANNKTYKLLVFYQLLDA